MACSASAPSSRAGFVCCPPGAGGSAAWRRFPCSGGGKKKAFSFASEPSNAAFLEDKSVVLHVSALFNLASLALFFLSALSSSCYLNNIR